MKHRQLRNAKVLPIRTVRSQATSKDKAGALPPGVHADKSTICAKVDLEREVEAEHLPKHATGLTFVKDRSISVNVGDKIPPKDDEYESDPEDDSFEIDGRRRRTTT